ncbi:MAG: GNAT family N-acyltransferase [Paracoccaceae bacterium]|nr:GNAT family N-acyltransferase [Paracoccaceae bacterium]
MDEHQLTDLAKGRYRAGIVRSQEGIRQILELRARCFRSGCGPVGMGSDLDRHDAFFQQVAIHDTVLDKLVGCYRFKLFQGGSDIGNGYAAGYYDLSPLAGYQGPMLEMGRFCLAPGSFSPDVLRMAWGFLTRVVDQAGVRMIFGCSSFHGADIARHEDALALLRSRYLGPRGWLPRMKAVECFPFASRLVQRKPDPGKALKSMPPLLRSYLAMGGWVSDHAVIDSDLDTIHVFTGLEIEAIPPARARSLRAISS